MNPTSAIANILLPNPLKRPGASVYRGPGLVASFSDQIEFPEKTDEMLVFDSIRQIVETRKGERLLEPDFGSRIRELIFEPVSVVFESKVELFLTEAIRTYEPRCRLVSVAFHYDSNSVRIIYTLMFLQIGRMASSSISLPRVV